MIFGFLIILLWLWATEEKLKDYDELLKSSGWQRGGHSLDPLESGWPSGVAFDCVFTVGTISAREFHTPEQVGSNI